MSVINPKDERSTEDQRRDSRFDVKRILFPGHLECVTTGAKYEIRPVDVSRRGMGFLVKHSLKTGRYFLKLEGKTLNVELVYCNSHLGIDNLFRCGMFCRDPDENLRNLFDELNLLSTN